MLCHEVILLELYDMKGNYRSKTYARILLELMKGNVNATDRRQRAHGSGLILSNNKDVDIHATH